MGRADPARRPLAFDRLQSESDFYHGYRSTLNAFPTVAEAMDLLKGELDKLDRLPPDWRGVEVTTNVFLLSCSISCACDDYVAGPFYDFSRVVRVLPWAQGALSVLTRLTRSVQGLRGPRLEPLRRWRAAWEESVHRLVGSFVGDGEPDQVALSQCRARQSDLLQAGVFPPALVGQRVRIPAAFRSQDLTHFDILALGDRYLHQLQDLGRPVLVLGLRTAGSYFAPLLRGYLAKKGCSEVGCLTTRPWRDVERSEAGQLEHWARRGARVVVVDEPMNSGKTVAMALTMLAKAGFGPPHIVVLAPAHPSRPSASKTTAASSSHASASLLLEPESWHKHRLLQPALVEDRMREYFQARRYRAVTVVPSPTADGANARLTALSEEKFHNRLKRVFELRLENPAGEPEIRYVLAKSVGWGWLGYHAFLAADALAEFVPPVLGLRDGILYTEWRCPDEGSPAPASSRDPLVDRIASYVAARVRSLGLGEDPTRELIRDGWHPATDILADALSQAYGSRFAATLERQRLRQELARRPCPVPTLIDGKMRKVEWIDGGGHLLKTDFEHHGLGKTELNCTDPAYDLADAMLGFGFDPGEEARLIARYVGQSNDSSVGERLFPNKLLAGLSEMRRAAANLGDARLCARQQEFHRQYVDAWNFLTLHTTRFAAGLCPRPDALRWGRRVVVLDVDGVLDKLIFGFPSTTAAGIRALSLLHAHRLPIALNTARTVREVKEYSQAYGFVGGAAEYGSCVWDAISDRERVLVSGESLDELERLKRALGRLPGVFVNDDYRYSVRAHTYAGERTRPLPDVMIQALIASLGLERLQVHQTYLDTAVLAREVDKGVGLTALLDLAGCSGAEVDAIGDSEADLPMFRVARRSFAPAHISCRDAAYALGCRVADRPYQPGMLRSVRALLHPDGRSCGDCRSAERAWPRSGDIVLTMFEAADQRPFLLALRALLDPASLNAFRH